MTNIIWVGNRFFAPFIEHENFSVRFVDFAPGEYLDWRALNAKHPIAPSDILVVGDKSLPPPVLGIERFPCLTVLYVVDSHIHSWYPYYAQAFDLCLVSLKDHLNSFSDQRLLPEQVRWMPPCCLTEPVSPDSPLAAKKEWDLLFVGTVNERINPERVKFMRDLQTLLPSFHYTSGNFNALYPKAKLVLNHSIAGDLNFRVFEALGSGACLLTPRIGHGLEALFNNGADLFLYNQDDLAGLAASAQTLLQDEDLRLRVARSGFRKVTANHLGTHRAAELLDIIVKWRADGTDQRLIKRRLREAPDIHKQYLRLIYLLLAENLPELPDLRTAYLAAAQKSD